MHTQAAQIACRVSISINLHAKCVTRWFLVFPSVLLWTYTKTGDLPSKYRLHEQCFCAFWSSPVFHFAARYNRISPFQKSVVPTKHRSTMYSRLTINLLNHFKCFYGIKTGFPAKTNRPRCPIVFSNLWHGQNKQVTSHHEYVPHCERFELKLGVCGKEALLTNFSKFHRDRATSTMFSHRCRKTYRTDLVCELKFTVPQCNPLHVLYTPSRLCPELLIPCSPLALGLTYPENSSGTN